MLLNEMLTVNATTGATSPTGMVVMVVDKKEARILGDALDAYLTLHPDNKEAKALYHALAWQPGRFIQADRSKPCKSISERK